MDPKLILYLCHEKCEESGGVFEVGRGWSAKSEQNHCSVVKRNGLPTIEDVEAKLEENLDFEDSIAVDSHKEASISVLAAVMEHED